MSLTSSQYGANVTDRLSICNTNQCGLGYPRGEGPRRAMEVSLPNLEVSKQVVVAGDVSDLTMPKFSYGDLRVLSENTSVRFDFPQLINVYYALDLQGNISSLSMPRLKNVPGSITIKSSHPLNVSLPVVRSRHIFLGGEIKDLTIDSNLPIDCGKLTDAINRTYEGPKDRYWLSCRSTREESSGLSTKAKVAIGVVVGVVGLSVIIGWIFWRKRRSSKRRKATGDSGSAIELTTFGTGLRREDRGQAHGDAEGQDDAPPPYTPRE
ncbi:hypothetical protein EYZ11_010752 [Aspergillus tanneri]|uniref:Uncharacterized protein n=1 Tax=Aspergillus tanneri TaxID=1220188 RepID=A0A4S3J4J1_9EURO|nr:hypothetical protein EYZ11_010752 [Aspergillus tanneri]